MRNVIVSVIVFEMKDFFNFFKRETIVRKAHKGERINEEINF